jgi:hypothetical protein
MTRAHAPRQVLDELEALPGAVVIGDTVPDKLYPLPKIDKHIRRAHTPGKPDWRDCIMLHEKNERGLYLPLAVPETGGEHLYGQKDADGNAIRGTDGVIDVDGPGPPGAVKRP